MTYFKTTINQWGQGADSIDSIKLTISKVSVGCARRTRLPQ
jgi:hypothetical protein